MAKFEPQIKLIRVSASAWAIAYHILRTGKDTFSQSELKSAACGPLDVALADGLIVKLESGLYRANIELARLYASLLPRISIRGRRRKEVRALKECFSEERREAAEMGQAWLELAMWADVHAEDKKEVPKEILEVLSKHGIELRRMTLPSGAKVILAKVLNYYIVMDSLMVKNTPKCAKYSRLGPDAWLCASTKEKLFSYLKPLAPRPQN